LANLTEKQLFDAAVYELSTTDPVMGGPSGVDNKPHQQLANRTAWLKQQVDALLAAGGSAAEITAAINAHLAAADPHTQYTTNAEVIALINANKQSLASLGAEPAFAKNTAFNKNFGAGASNVAKGNHSHTPASLGAVTPAGVNAQIDARALKRVNMPQGLRRVSTHLSNNYQLQTWSDTLEDGHYDVYLSIPQNGLPTGWYYIDVHRHVQDTTTNQWRTLTATSFGAGNTPNQVYKSTCSLGVWTPFERLAQARPGEVFAYAKSTPPPHSLECNGAQLSRSAYAALFAVIGTTFGATGGSTTFNLPDLRGEFIRGWDHGRGADAARIFGSWQADAFRSHTHGVPGYNLVSGSGIPWYNWGGPATCSSQPNTDASGGAETRPRNRALLYCITY